jgi:hypothetical protein
MEPEKLQDQETPKPRWPVAAAIWRVVKGVIKLYLVLMVIIILLFQIPAVQNWAAQRAATSLSKTLRTTVAVGKLNFTFLDELVLEQLYVEDITPQDTLLYSQRLYANFDLNPITYLLRGLVIEEIRLENARVNIRTEEASAQNNVQIMLERLFPPDTTTIIDREPRPFRLDVKRLVMDEIRFIQDDKEAGKSINVYLPHGKVLFDEINLPMNYVNTEQIYLSGPYVSIKEYNGKPYTGYDSLMFNTLPVEPEISLKQPFSFTSGKLDIENALFSLHNYRREPKRNSPEDELDFEHMDLYNINIGVEYFTFCEDSLDFSGQVERLACKTSSGFELEQLSARKARVWCQGMELYDMYLKTPDSNLGDTLIFSYSTYEDWIDFPSRVNMEAHINNSAVTLKDIITFAPALKQNTFFSNNANRKLYINGLINGRVNRLSGENINIWLEDKSLVIRGEFGTRDLTVRQSELVNLNLQELSTNMTTLRQLIPGFNPPPNFDKLGKMRFDGRFDGYFTDFVANGRLQSSLGVAEMDMQLRNLKQGRAYARYNGKLQLINFDLGAWSDNPDLGKFNFESEVANGVGLTANTATAQLTATVDSFVYKGYQYENAELTGTLEENSFQGNFSIKDKNIDFSFSGEVNMKDSIPRFDFTAAVDRLDLYQLNLTKQPLSLAGDIGLNIRNNTLSKLEGNASIADFVIVNEKVGKTQIDNILFYSNFDSLGNRSFVVESDLLEADLYGLFDIEQVPIAFMQYLEEQFPAFFARLGMKSPKKLPGPHSFSFDVKVKDSQNLLEILDPRIGPIADAELEGYFDNIRDSIDFSLRLPQFSFNKITLNNVGVVAWLEQSEGMIDILVEQPVINETELSTVKLITQLEEDTIDFALAYQSGDVALLNELQLDTKLFLEDSINYRMEFSQSGLTIKQMPWIIDNKNYITFREGYIDTKNFLLTNNEREIRLETVGKKGLNLSLTNMNFSFIDEIWDYDALNFAGSFDVNAEVKDIFNLNGITANVQGDTLWVNDDDWGVFRLDLRAEDLKSRLYANLFLTKDTSQIVSNGYFNLAEQTGKKGASNLSAQYFDFNIFATNLPVAMAEYWLEGTVSNTVGSFDSNLRIFGAPPKPRIEGDLLVSNAALTVDFLQTRYYIDQQTIVAKDFLFDATGAIIKDKFGNIATVEGGMTHNYLKDLGIDASLKTNHFLALDTKKGDNELFYGRAMGKGEVDFNGPLNRIDIYVNARVGDSTRLVIPVSYGSDASELSYIRFNERKREEDINKVGEDKSPQSLTGIDLEMDLAITDEAIGEIVFDEQAGDIIKGRGRGNIRILVPRNGGFEMYGDYIIEEGDYLFTLYNVVNKKFTIKRGGIINWSGDPYEAKIRLEAEYRGLSTPVANLIQEYLLDAPPGVQSNALQATEVDLTMDLRGDLLKPTINFDIDFPQLTGPLETLTDSKLRVIRQDPNELNRQVFGLIVAGQFLPSDFAFQGSEIFYNTVSEFVSNQLSLLLTELFSEFFSNGNNSGTFSGFDFDIAYNQYQSTGIQGGDDIVRGDEFQVRLKQDFFNDRLTILVGGNVDIGNSAQATNPNATGTFVGNDLVIEYVLNDDRTMKLRIYQRLEPDIGGGSRLEVGTGLSFRKEFDSFGEFLRSFKRDVED